MKKGDIFSFNFGSQQYYLVSDVRFRGFFKEFYMLFDDNSHGWHTEFPSDKLITDIFREEFE